MPIVTVTFSDNFWHVHSDGRLICSTVEEKLARYVAAAHRQRFESGQNSAVDPANGPTEDPKREQ